MTEIDIRKIGKKIGLSEKDLFLYGTTMAKIIKSPDNDRKGKLILTTAMTPTKAGEGKTTTAIGLADGLSLLGNRACLALREPSLGPVFGVKGGGTGGGKERLEPEEKINLHFTGDIHALTSATNLIAAMIDNEIFQKSELDLDPESISFPRAMDMNDRSLRRIATCLNPKDGPRHESSFVITAASELMAIFCLCKDEEDFLDRVENITIGKDTSGRKVTVKALNIRNAIRKLMEDALSPNLVQTMEGTPAIVHGGPFANIAHGTNSLIATSLALKVSDYVVTEAGFGSDLGMEKYLDIVSPLGNFSPDLVVLVGSIRAMKLHGGVPFSALEERNDNALVQGFENLLFHYHNGRQYGLPVLVSLNVFPQDTKGEIALVSKLLEEKNIPFALNTSYQEGGVGAKGLAEKVLLMLSSEKKAFHPLVDKRQDVMEKIKIIATHVYGAKDVVYEEKALEQIKNLSEEERHYDVCISKTPNSLSDDPHLLNVPEHVLHVRSLRLFDGARFLVPLTGAVVTMPGLPKVPLAKRMER